MRIHSLGHTECLIEIPTPEKTVHILLDAWLSAYSVADLMERTPRISIDWATFPRIDLVYISHAHLDHLDPYFLSVLYSQQSPILLIAETISYVIPTLKTFLPNAQIEVLKPSIPYSFQGAKLTGLTFANDELTNEEDVMSLFVEHGDTALYFEIDTIPPEDPEEQKKLHALFTKKPYKHRLYVASRNELEGNLSILDLPPAKRKSYEKQYRSTRKEWMEWQYAKFESWEAEYRDIRDLSGFSLACIGQGMCFPTSVSAELASTRILPLDEIAEIERSIARRYRKKFDIFALSTGKMLDLQSEKILFAPSSLLQKDSTGWTKNTMRYSPLPASSIDHAISFERADSPLSKDVRDRNTQESSILDALNTKFLPTKLADTFDHLKNIVLKNPDHAYRIEVRFWTQAPFESRFYIWNFWQSTFLREFPEEQKRVDERYFANDLDDFLSGKQELYCNFLHRLDPKMSYRLWTVLGNTFLNNDLVIQKLTHHFMRIKNGADDASFVLEFYHQNIQLQNSHSTQS